MVGGGGVGLGWFGGRVLPGCGVSDCRRKVNGL